MTKHTWTPDAVHDIVAPWPDLARASIGWAPESRQWVQFDGTPLLSYLAAAAHVESGLVRLCSDGLSAYEFEGWADGKVSVTRRRVEGKRWVETQLGVCPTLLHAVSAAIMAAGGGK